MLHAVQQKIIKRPKAKGMTARIQTSNKNSGIAGVTLCSEALKKCAQHSAKPEVLRSKLRPVCRFPKRRLRWCYFLVCTFLNYDR
jgi:hypothetical protein